MIFDFMKLDLKLPIYENSFAPHQEIIQLALRSKFCYFDQLNLPMNSFPLLLASILKKVEWISLAVTFLGLLFKFLQYPGYSNLIVVGAMTLACCYFLSSFVLIPQPASDGKKGFSDLLGETILPKLLYIGLAVFCIGFLFALLHLNGANEMLIIAIGTLVMGSFFSMILILGNRERMKLLQAPVIRAVTALLFYFILPLLK